MLLKRLPAPILIINHVHYSLAPCLQPPLLRCFGGEFPRQSFLLPDVQPPVFIWVKTTVWSPENNKVFGFTMRNVATMNYHFKTTPLPPPQIQYQSHHRTWPTSVHKLYVLLRHMLGLNGETLISCRSAKFLRHIRNMFSTKTVSSLRPAFTPL